MDCTICGKPTPPGAKLCVPCKAALKRARYMTVQDDIRRPSIIDVRRPPRRARAPAPTPVPVPKSAKRVPDHATPVPIRASSDFNFVFGRRIFVGIAVVAAVLGSISYFGLREIGAHAGDPAPASRAAETRQVASASVAAPGMEEAAPLTPSAASAVAPVVVGRDSPVPPAAKPPVKRSQLASGATFATANGDPPDAVYVAPEPAKPAPAPPPPPPAPDRWQSMADAQAQCDRQGVIDGLICGQRVKMQYCDGYWGKVSQCQGANVPYDR